MSGNSPAPGTPQTPFKAFAATALTFVGAFVAYWIADTGTFDPKEWGEAALTAAAASGVTGFATYKVKNKAL